MSTASDAEAVPASSSDGAPGNSKSNGDAPISGAADGESRPAGGVEPTIDADAVNGGEGEPTDGTPVEKEEPQRLNQLRGGADAERKEERFLYGFVFCRQRQDASLRRGGEQMSVVVLAEHPLSSVLLPLSAVAGHQYFAAPGKGPLQQVYDEVCRWPPPVAGQQLQLPVGFTALTARLPLWNTLPHPSTVSAAEQYGNNTLPIPRGASVRSIGPTPGGTPTRRTATAVSDVDSLLGSAGSMPRLASGAVASVLSPASSNASAVVGVAPQQPQQHQLGIANGSGGGGLGSPGPGLAGDMGATSASPFVVSGGGGQQPEQVVVAPPQQQLERRRSSGSGATEDGPGTGPTGPSGAGATGAALSGGGAGALAGVPGGPPFGPPPEGSLQQISGLLADGCSPATVPVYPVPMPMLGGPPALAQHQRSRSSVLVPSRTSSYAGAIDELLAPSLTSQGGSRVALGPQFEAISVEDPAGARVLSGQGWRRMATSPQITANEGGPISGAFHEADVYTPLSGHLPRLWQLWEMTLLGRALLLVAPTPGETAAGVAALVSLVAPLPYAPDFRPYYCIHDTAFSRMASGVLPGPEARDVPTLLGVTNLYFIRALPHWPNVLSIGKRDQGGPGQGAVAAVAPSGSLAASMARANAAVQALRQRTQGASVLMSGHTEALWSSYKPLCRPDQALLQKLMQPKAGDVKSKVARIAFVNSDLIRRHFAELTTSFLAPFGRYFEPDTDGLVPGWNSEEFLFGLRSGGLALPQPLLDRVGSPAAAVELYARFTSSLNFAAWFAGRRRHIAHLIAPWPRARGGSEGGTADGSAGRGTDDGAAGDGGAGGAAAGRGSDGGAGARGDDAGESEDEEGGIASWFKSAAQHLDEVKLIGLFFTVEQQLMDAQVEAASPDAPDEAAATVSRLQRELAMLFFGAMSEELQLTCVSSPARRELLRSLVLTATQAARVQHLLDMLQLGGK